MKLSPIYDNRISWTVVYETGHHPELPEVELVEDRFFESCSKAWAWFVENYNESDFIKARPVPVSGFQFLKLD